MILEVKTAARTLARKAGLIPALHRFRMLWHTSDYEDKFSAALLAAVTVWDIGANVGYYTEELSRRASHVVAFEPVLDNFLQIEARGLGNVTCRKMALGDRKDEVRISKAGTTSSLVGGAVGDDLEYEVVMVMPGDALVDLPRPDVVKIDVEGFELEVTQGLNATLKSVRAVYMEVHFSVLASRGLQQQPALIVRELKGLGFSKVNWIDASHIEALR